MLVVSSTSATRPVALVVYQSGVDEVTTIAPCPVAMVPCSATPCSLLLECSTPASDPARTAEVMSPPTPPG